MQNPNYAPRPAAPAGALCASRRDPLAPQKGNGDRGRRPPRPGSLQLSFLPRGSCEIAALLAIPPFGPSAGASPVHQAAALLRASFRPAFATTRLRFANQDGWMGWIEE